VLVDSEGNAFLTDFGLAKMLGGSARLTGTGVGIGTPAYMSPEQGQAQKVDSRTDIYSLGVMLYEMVTGQVPYDADTPLAVVLKHINEPLPLPSAVRPDLPEQVERVILRAMAKEPEDRFQTAKEMVYALDAAVRAAEAAGRTEPEKKRTVPMPGVVRPAPQAGASRLRLPRWVGWVVGGVAALAAFALLGLALGGYRVGIQEGRLVVIRPVAGAPAVTATPAAGGMPGVTPTPSSTPGETPTWTPTPTSMPPDTATLSVRAYIDGSSYLVIQGDVVYWHHTGSDAPGRTSGPYQPTYLNGEAWYPSWPDVPDSRNRDCDCHSSTYVGIPYLAPRGQVVSLGIVQARHRVTIIQQPSVANGYTLIVDFDDGPPPSADWYEITLTYLASESPTATPIPGSPAEQARAFGDPILAAIADRPPDYADDFSDPGSGWPIGSTADGDEWGYKDEAYYISVTRFYRNPSGDCCLGIRLSPAPIRVTDYVLEVDAQFVSGEWGGWDVLFRESPPTREQPVGGAVYFVSFSPGGAFDLHKNIIDEDPLIQISLAQGYVPTFEQGTGTNRLTVIVQGPRIMLYVNGEPLRSVYDEPSGRGKIALGFGACNSADTPLRMHFDNLKVWDITDLPVSTP
jgi:hypothetical protein